MMIMIKDGPMAVVVAVSGRCAARNAVFRSDVALVAEVSAGTILAHCSSCIFLALLFCFHKVNSAWAISDNPTPIVTNQPPAPNPRQNGCFWFGR